MVGIDQENQLAPTNVRRRTLRRALYGSRETLQLSSCNQVSSILDDSAAQNYVKLCSICISATEKVEPAGPSDAVATCRSPDLRVVIHRWLLLVATFIFAGASRLFGASPATEEHRLPQQAVDIARPFGLPITNSMVVTWIVALCLIIYAWVATRNMKAVPDGAQNFLEWLVGGLYSFLEGIIGPHLVKRTFWFFATIFIFILSANWFGLIPGVGTIGWGHQTTNGFIIDNPLFRGANADLNLTLAMALVFFACWIIWALQEVGLVGFLKGLFAPKGETAGPLKVLMVVVFFAVGCLEIVSILFRPISLSFRLYGNIFAGENMLETMSKMVPGLGWLLPVPFYFLELLVGLVQALVFMLLTAVFTLLICQHEEESPVAPPETET